MRAACGLRAPSILPPIPRRYLVSKRRNAGIPSVRAQGTGPVRYRRRRRAFSIEDAALEYFTNRVFMGMFAPRSLVSLPRSLVLEPLELGLEPLALIGPPPFDRQGRIPRE